jgi:hypothetical protein
MDGNWKGFYKYQSSAVSKITGHEKTRFIIKINSFDGINFEGEVSEDESTGGMDGVGIIKGNVSHGNIAFIKQMPFQVQIIDKEGTRNLDRTKKHSPLYYHGTAIGENHFAGTWKFKQKWGLLFGLIPIYFSPGKGTWEMERQ